MFDPSNAVVPGATITVQNQGTGRNWTTETDSGGNYTVAALPIGVYRVSATADGFKTAIREDLRLQVSDRLRVDFSLDTGSVTEQVTVTSQAPLVDTDSSTLGAVVSTRQVQDLPLNGRSFTELLQVVPGAMLRGACADSPSTARRSSDHPAP